MYPVIKRGGMLDEVGIISIYNLIKEQKEFYSIERRHIVKYDGDNIKVNLQVGFSSDSDYTTPYLKIGFERNLYDRKINGDKSVEKVAELIEDVMRELENNGVQFFPFAWKKDVEGGKLVVIA